MTVEQLLAGYRWVYREFYSWRNILRRLPANQPGYASRTLMFNLALKKIDWVWLLLRQWGLLYHAFHIYRWLERVSVRRRFAQWGRIGDELSVQAGEQALAVPDSAPADGRSVTAGV